MTHNQIVIKYTSKVAQYILYVVRSRRPKKDYGYVTANKEIVVEDRAIDWCLWIFLLLFNSLFSFCVD